MFSLIAFGKYKRNKTYFRCEQRKGIPLNFQQVKNDLNLEIRQRNNILIDNILATM